jgi:hypothetical protein
MKRIFLIFKLTAVFFYLAFGVILLFFDIIPLPLSSSKKTFLGIVLILYGLFRIYSYYSASKVKDDED